MLTENEPQPPQTIAIASRPAKTNPGAQIRGGGEVESSRPRERSHRRKAANQKQIAITTMLSGHQRIAGTFSGMGGAPALATGETEQVTAVRGAAGAQVKTGVPANPFGRVRVTASAPQAPRLTVTVAGETAS